MFQYYKGTSKNSVFVVAIVGHYVEEPLFISIVLLNEKDFFEALINDMRARCDMLCVPFSFLLDRA